MTASMIAGISRWIRSQVPPRNRARCARVSRPTIAARSPALRTRSQIKVDRAELGVGDVEARGVPQEIDRQPGDRWPIRRRGGWP